jgi:hypothetical protein
MSYDVHTPKICYLGGNNVSTDLIILDYPGPDFDFLNGFSIAPILWLP